MARSSAERPSARAARQGRSRCGSQAVAIERQTFSVHADQVRDREAQHLAEQRRFPKLDAHQDLRPSEPGDPADQDLRPSLGRQLLGLLRPPGAAAGDRQTEVPTWPSRQRLGHRPRRDLIQPSRTAVQLSLESSFRGPPMARICAVLMNTARLNKPLPDMGMTEITGN